jgi:hypothetical protein
MVSCWIKHTDSFESFVLIMGFLIPVLNFVLLWNAYTTEAAHNKPHPV